MNYDSIQNILNSISKLELAILIGSRSTGKFGSESDWDIAIQWSREMLFFEQLAATEKLRKEIADLLHLSDQAIDLIDIPTARLTMRAVIAEEGIVLKGAGALAWHRFLQRSWRELEEHYWEEIYAS